MAIKPHITADELRELLDYNPETGIFRWKKESKYTKVGEIAGTNHSSGYLQIGYARTAYLSHRLAWLHFYGEIPKNIIDHINGNKKDNRIANLRDVTRSVNSQNIKKHHKRNKEELIGAWKHQAGGYFSQIKVLDKHIHLGYFKSAEEAHNAYIEAKRKLHAGCTI